MAYTDPTTRSLNDLITASIWNTDIVANIQHLFNRPLVVVKPTGEYSSNSATFVDIDSSELTLSIDIESTRLLVMFQFTADAWSSSPSNSYLRIDFTANGTRVSGSGSSGPGVARFDGSSNEPAVYTTRTIFYVIEGLTPGTVVITPQWRHSGGSGTRYLQMDSNVNNNPYCVLAAMEI